MDAHSYIINLTKKYVNKMDIQYPVYPSVVELPLNVDAQTTPYTVSTRNGKDNMFFNIEYNRSFIDANKNNLYSGGIVGVVVHELAHVKNFIEDKQSYLKNPHTNKLFKGYLIKYMGAESNTKLYEAAYRPFLSFKAALNGSQYEVAPSWLANYYIYSCPKCCFLDTYITDLRSKIPRCEECNNPNVIAIKLPVEDAAKLNISVGKSIDSMSATDKDKFLRAKLTRYFESHLSGQNKSRFNAIKSDNKFCKTINRKQMKYVAMPLSARKPHPSRPTADICYAKRNK